MELPVYSRIAGVLVLIALSPLCGAAEPKDAATGCAAFTWNVVRELEVMRSRSTAVIAAANVADPEAKVELGRHYSVILRPQAEVRFALPPARAARDAAPRAGLLAFEVHTAGRYRIVIDSRHWIDVIANGRTIDSSDHQGAGGCESIHKIVEFELPAKTPLTLQLSGREDDSIGLAITPSPASP